MSETKEKPEALRAPGEQLHIENYDEKMEALTNFIVQLDPNFDSALSLAGGAIAFNCIRNAISKEEYLNNMGALYDGVVEILAKKELQS